MKKHITPHNKVQKNYNNYINKIKLQNTKSIEFNTQKNIINLLFIFIPEVLYVAIGITLINWIHSDCPQIYTV